MIYWIFGGSAVGKKRFIEQALDPETRPAFLVLENPLAVWINDGALVENLESLADISDLLIRWQWDREEVLIDMLSTGRGQHTIIVLTVGLSTQISRALTREGVLHWNIETFHNDQREMFERLYKIRSRFQIPTWFVDATSPIYTLRGHCL
jgi:hypothetical protein